MYLLSKVPRGIFGFDEERFRTRKVNDKLKAEWERKKKYKK